MNSPFKQEVLMLPLLDSSMWEAEKGPLPVLQYDLALQPSLLSLPEPTPPIGLLEGVPQSPPPGAGSRARISINLKGHNTQHSGHTGQNFSSQAN